MSHATAIRAVSTADAPDSLADLAGRMDPAQRQVLAEIITAVVRLEACGDQPGVDKLLDDASALLKAARA